MRKAIDFNQFKSSIVWVLLLDGEYAGKLLGVIGQRNSMTITIEIREGDLGTIYRERDTVKLDKDQPNVMLLAIQAILRKNKYIPRALYSADADATSEFVEWGYEVIKVIDN